MKKINPVGVVVKYNFQEEFYAESVEYKKIIGIDPGLKNLGIGVISVNSYHQMMNYSGILIKIKQDRTIEQKLSYIYEEICKIIECVKPDLIMSEDAFVGMNKGSALKLGYTRGVIFAAIGKYEIKLKTLSPKAVKMQVSGKGDCSKEDLQEKLKKIFTGFDIESLDVVDAISCAICGLDYLNK